MEDSSSESQAVYPIFPQTLSKFPNPNAKEWVPASYSQAMVDAYVNRYKKITGRELFLPLKEITRSTPRQSKLRNSTTETTTPEATSREEAEMKTATTEDGDEEVKAEEAPLPSLVAMMEEDIENGEGAEWSCSSTAVQRSTSPVASNATSLEGAKEANEQGKFVLGQTYFAIPAISNYTVSAKPNY